MDEDILARRIVYGGCVDAGLIRVTRGLPYGTDPSCVLDLYRPAIDEVVPVVLLVHGGPAVAPAPPNDWGIFRSYGELLAASGLAAAMFTHRLFGTATLDAGRLDLATRDLDTALAWLATTASAYRLDAARSALWVFSGGGLLLGPVVRRCPPSVRCIVAYYAALDLVALRNPAGSALTGEAARHRSPARHLRDAAMPLPPWLIARAGRDRPELNAGIDLAVAELLAANAPLDLLTLPDGRHGFDILDDARRSREVIQHTLAFLAARLGPPARHEVSCKA